MSAAGFWIVLAVIAAGAILLTIGGVIWAVRPPAADEPIEHGDGEP